MSIETSAVEAWLTQKLSTDSVLKPLITGVFSEKAPNDQPPPYIVFSQQGTNDVTEVAWFRIMVECMYLVEVIDQSRSYTSIQAMADRIDAVLHPSAGVALGHTIAMCVRESATSQVEDFGDFEWRRLGGRFHIFVQ